MDILKRAMAPISDAAWQEIEAEATRVLRGNLSARKIVDFEGPTGWETAAINLGGISVGSEKFVDGVDWGTREVLPLVESRAAFALNIWDLDNVNRGGKTPNLNSVAAAARKMAMFEEKAVYQGFKSAGIVGISEGGNKPVTLPKTAGKMAEAVESAVVTLQTAGVGGPYALVLGTKPYQMLMSGDEKGYPLRRRVEELVGGQIVWSPAVTGGVLVSTRGGDFQLTCGQDLSIGYQKHDSKEVVLFLTESFTFQVLEPAAAVTLKMA
jgi:uncharacterized linocin/CFP29 family protein